MSIFKNLGDSFQGLTKKIWGYWAPQTDPALASLEIMKNNGERDTVNKVLISSFFDIKESKEEIIKELDKIKDFYFSQLIIDRIMDDALNPSGNENRLFSATVHNSEGEVDTVATKLINDFISEFNIQKLIKDVAADLLIYGEYALRLDVANIDDNSNSQAGIINIHDDVDISTIVPVYRDSDISYYLSMGDKKLQITQPTKYVYFCMPTNRIKVKINGVDDKIVYIRMGKSILYPVFGLIKELKFFETLVPIEFVSDALRMKLIGVSVPPHAKPDEARKAALAFEKLINNSLKIADLNDSDEEVLKKISAQVGEVKVIPVWGDKGELQAQDFQDNTDYDALFEKITDLRKMILTTVGVPSNIMDDENLKSDTIKESIRYSKLLKSFQFALAEGLQRLFLIHLTNNGFTNFIKEDIKIQFLNVLDVDDLEKLEYIDLMISMMDNFKSFVEDYQDHEKVQINWEDYVKFLNSQLNNVTGFDILTVKEDNDEGDENEI